MASTFCALKVGSIWLMLKVAALPAEAEDEHCYRYFLPLLPIFVIVVCSNYQSFLNC